MRKVLLFATALCLSFGGKGNNLSRNSQDFLHKIYIKLTFPYKKVQ